MDSTILTIGLIKSDIAIRINKDYDRNLKNHFSDVLKFTRDSTKLIGCLGEGIYEMNVIRNYPKGQENTDSIIIPRINAGTTLTVTKKANTYVMKENSASIIHTAGFIDSMEEVVNGIDLVIAGLEVPTDVIEEVAECCKKYNVRFMLYPVPVLKIPDVLLCKIDIIVSNARDIEAITGKTVIQTGDAIKAVKYLLDRGVGQVVLEEGDQGIIFNKGYDIIRKIFPNSKSKDESGDLFAGVLSVYLAMGRNIDEAVEFAHIVSSAAVLE